ncbi:pentapeptide repeat-containing protein [Streptomyces sp. NPDC007851]|uniref:pentapeptide repeat-containing protein n=1 Tax=Streptomyces sp. NPDC007851 TaxID=3155008 RepID=UPI0033FE01F4
MNTPSPPSWPYCGHAADPATDPVGCTGVRVSGYTACLAHLPGTERTAYLSGLAPGSAIDHRGTHFTEELLEDLLDALEDPSIGAPHLGDTRFDGARFWCSVVFDRVRFSGTAWFRGAKIDGNARFERAQFSGDARFERAEFSGEAWFERAQFSGEAWFEGAQFSDTAWFEGAQFSGNARFAGAQLRDAWFERAQFSGEAWFERAQFSDAARFRRVQFSDTARFEGAQFSADARFEGAQFSGDALFVKARFSGAGDLSRAQFSGNAWFGGAEFSGEAWFRRVQFSGTGDFSRAQFSADARFEGAQFSGYARFGGAQFSGDARFDEARFEGASVLGPLLCGSRVVVSGAVFVLPVTLEIAAAEVVCARTRWESTVTVRVRYAAVDLRHAVLAAPTSVTAHPTPFIHRGQKVREDLLGGPGPQPRPAGVRVVSVQGVDAAHLVLTDTDLTDCLFSGAFHLDQIRLEGRTSFASTPTGWHRRGIRPVRWTRRRTLAEEHHWRAQSVDQPVPPGPSVSLRQWRPGPHHPDPAHTPDPEDVAALYRQLRKAFEDGKNEPGAADFYYGECEMRRHDVTGTPRGERRLLWGYWLLSGYGLRASRAFGWLIAAMSLTVLLLMGVGLPTHDPDPATAGTLHGHRISLRTSIPDPTLRGGWNERLTAARAEKATQVAINSVVFRSSGQNLTTAGTYIEMASRLLEPTLLALGALAIRGRIKR